MNSVYYKSSSSYPVKKFPDYEHCDNYCQKDLDVDLINFDKNSQQCECLIQVDNISDANEIYGDLSSDYKINPIAFWITFSIFIIFILILIFFFIKVFFIKVKK